MPSTTTNSVDVDKMITIKLDRGKTGLGFNIKGGSDMQLFPGDDGIYVAKIKEEGAAGIDGRLKVGDKIVSVNGNSLEGVAHDFAVRTFVRAGSSVTIEVVSGAEQTARRRLRHKEEAGAGFLTVPKVLVAVGLVATFAFGFYRFKRSRFSS